MRWLFALLALLSPLAALSADFTGTWRLDDAASQSMDDVLALQDISWAKRKVAGYLDNNVVIVQSSDRMTVTFENVLGSHRQELVFSGQPHQTVNPAGLPTAFASRWVGEELVCTGPTSDGEGLGGVITERRSLSADEQTMILMVTVETGGQQATVKRVFRRVE